MTGVERFTFKEMVEILKAAEKKKLALGGSKPSKTVEDRLLMTLEYWREYRTYFHIASSYNTSESTAFRYVRWVENTLIKNKLFALPSRRALLKSDMEFEIVMIDATESPCERPKKGRNATILARKSGTRKKLS